MTEDFFVHIDGKIEGPFGREEIEDLHGAGLITKNSKCRRSDVSLWLTVDDHVPTAKWVTSPKNEPRLLRQTSSARTMNSPDNSYGERCVNAGWVCAAITALTAWFMLTPSLMAIPAAGILSGAAAIIFGELKKGTAVIVTIAAIVIAWPAIQWTMFARDMERNNMKLRNELNQSQQDLENSLRQLIPGR